MIIDPNNFDKRSNFDECSAELREYARVIDVELPNITLGAYENAYNGWSARGMYIPRENRINVDLKKCKVATKNPGFAWSYTGYKADMTPAGVLAHEFGHHYDHVRSVVKKHRRTIGELRDAEGCVSSYCPNPSEWFAETFRLWFLNHDLLWQAKPRTFYFMMEVLRLPYPRSESWRDILINAHPKFISACERIIAMSSFTTMSSFTIVRGSDDRLE